MLRTWDRTGRGVWWSRGGGRLVVGLLLCVWMLVAGAAVGGCATAPVAATDQPALDGDRPHASIRFLLYRHLPVARASIDGEDVGFFLIDTGSSLTVVDRRTAKRLGLEQLGGGVVRGVGGVERVPYCVVNDLRVDRLRVGRHLAAMVDLSEFNRSVGLQVSGILGINVLGASPFTIDYAEATVTRHDSATFTPAAGAKAVPLRLVDRLPAVPATVGAGSRAQAVMLQIDTGANGSLMLPYAFVSKRLDLLSRHRNVETRSYGVGGGARNIHARVSQLTVFGDGYPDVIVGVEVDSPNGEHEGVPVGRLGNRLLDRYRMTLDVPGGWAYLERIARPGRAGDEGAE